MFRMILMKGSKNGPNFVRLRLQLLYNQKGHYLSLYKNSHSISALISIAKKLEKNENISNDLFHFLPMTRIKYPMHRSYLRHPDSLSDANYTQKDHYFLRLHWVTMYKDWIAIEGSHLVWDANVFQFITILLYYCLRFVMISEISTVSKIFNRKYLDVFTKIP